MGQRAGGLEVAIRNWEVGKLDCGMPSATSGGEFLHTDIFEMAAGYLFLLPVPFPDIQVEGAQNSK